MTYDSGVKYSPLLPGFGRVGYRIIIPDPGPGDTQVTATLQHWVYGPPGKEGWATWSFGYYNTHVSFYSLPQVERHIIIPGSGTANVSVLVVSTYISLPVYKNNDGGSGYFYINSDITLANNEGLFFDSTDYIPPRPYYLPDQVTGLGLANLDPTTVQATFDPPYGGGTTIDFYHIQYTTDPTFTNPLSTESPILVNLELGKIYYVRVRAKNSAGYGPFSAVSSIQLFSGPRIKLAGIYKNSVCYVKVAGIYKVAIPYIKVAGVWRNAGG